MFDTTILRGALTAAIAALALLAATGSASARTSETTFTDAAGDANSAPDIQSVTVTDDTSGKLVFRITTDAPTRPSDAGLFVYVNADHNLSTGGYNDGIEYVLGLDNTGFGIARVTSSGALAVQAPGSSGIWQGGVATFAVNRRDLGGTAGFTFFVASALVTSPGTYRDDAPNHGMWSYAPSSAIAIKLVASKAFTTPISTRVYSASMLVQRSDTGRFLGKEGRIDCSARIGSKPLPVELSTFVSTTYEGTKMTPGMCAWTLPPDAAGKTIRGTITASYGGATVSRSFSSRIG
jgi:hypothetical protein